MVTRWQLTAVCLCTLLAASSSHSDICRWPTAEFIGIRLGAHLWRTKAQRNAVAAIREFGGSLRYDYQFLDIDRNAKSPIPRFLLEPLGVDFFHNVVRVDLGDASPRNMRNTSLADETLRHLPCFPKLRVLRLDFTRATDNSLRYIGEMRRLERLEIIRGEEVSDRGVQYLRNLSRLRDLILLSSHITDKSLEVVGTMTQLEKLALHGNQFSDTGLAHLVGLSRLERLELKGPRRGSSAITDDEFYQLPDLEELRMQAAMDKRWKVNVVSMCTWLATPPVHPDICHWSTAES